jgi:methylated-DNA-[protein]-cysteine S-methyltransferase
MRNPSVYYSSLQATPIGRVHAALLNGAVVAVDFGIAAEHFATELADRFEQPIVRDDEMLEPALEAMKAYFEGDPRPLDLKTDISHMSIFQQQVLASTTGIPHGRTMTYGGVAQQLGDLAAIRAVGGALGANPVPIIIPCHRVIAADGKLGGYSGHGGPDTKRKLLVLEGALMI